MNTITTYVPQRTSLGKFKSIKVKQFAKKVIFYQLITLSVLMNVFLAHKVWNIRCSVNSQVIGYFTTKEKCGELEDSWFASTQTYIVANEQAILANNLDLIK